MREGEEGLLVVAEDVGQLPNCFFFALSHDHTLSNTASLWLNSYSSILPLLRTITRSFPYLSVPLSRCSSHLFRMLRHPKRFDSPRPFAQHVPSTTLFSLSGGTSRELALPPVLFPAQTGNCRIPSQSPQLFNNQPESTGILICTSAIITRVL